jgi:hypothetical protein
METLLACVLPAATASIAQHIAIEFVVIHQHCGFGSFITISLELKEK